MAMSVNRASPLHMTILPGGGSLVVNVRRSFELPTFFVDGKADCDVGESRQASPHDDVTWRWVTRSTEMAAQPCDFADIIRKSGCARRRGGTETIEQFQFKLR